MGSWEQSMGPGQGFSSSAECFEDMVNKQFLL